MYQESINHYNFEDFVESTSMPGMMDDLELIAEEAPEELKKDNRGFRTAGILSILAGVALFLGMNLEALGLADIIPAQNVIPFVLAAGIGALGFGLVKAFRKIFRRKNLNLPSLQIRRKTPAHISAREGQARQRRRAMAPPALPKQETFRRNRRLSKSLKDRVFMGVAGGLAKHSGISSSLIRLLFIGLFAISGGTAAFIYILLGMFLPNEKRLPPPAEQGQTRNLRVD